MSIRFWRVSGFALGLAVLMHQPAAAQESAAAQPAPRVEVRASFMASYGHDDAQAELGFEKQGRIGYALIELSGTMNSRVSFRFAVNPVNETEPKAACGQAGYFYPNSSSFLGNAGPAFNCTIDGNRRVDMYKFVALDWYNQQGPIREPISHSMPAEALP